MTTPDQSEQQNACPAQSLLKLLAGKWKPEIFRLALANPLRFNDLLRRLEGSNRQSIATALRELEASGLLERMTIQQKPLHIEYQLTEKGRSMIVIFEQLETLAS